MGPEKAARLAASQLMMAYKNTAPYALGETPVGQGWQAAPSGQKFSSNRIAEDARLTVIFGTGKTPKGSFSATVYGQRSLPTTRMLKIYRRDDANKRKWGSAQSECVVLIERT